MPQPHLRPPSLTSVWPISPAAPSPSLSSPSSTRPPPTPVPTNTPKKSLKGRPEPCLHSPSTATRTSLSRSTSTPPKPLESSSPIGIGPTSNPGTLGELATVVPWMTPGEPTPTAFNPVSGSPPDSSAPLTDSAIAARTASAPVCGVATRHLPTISRSLKITVWILVPPRSIPATSFFISGWRYCRPCGQWRPLFRAHRQTHPGIDQPTVDLSPHDPFGP